MGGWFRSARGQRPRRAEGPQDADPRHGRQGHGGGSAWLPQTLAGGEIYTGPRARRDRRHRLGGALRRREARLPQGRQRLPLPGVVGARAEPVVLREPEGVGHASRGVPGRLPRRVPRGGDRDADPLRPAEPPRHAAAARGRRAGGSVHRGPPGRRARGLPGPARGRGRRRSGLPEDPGPLAGLPHQLQRLVRHRGAGLHRGRLHGLTPRTENLSMSETEDRRRIEAELVADTLQAERTRALAFAAFAGLALLLYAGSLLVPGDPTEVLFDGGIRPWFPPAIFGGLGLYAACAWYLLGRPRWQAAAAVPFAVVEGLLPTVALAGLATALDPVHALTTPPLLLYALFMVLYN